MPATQPKVDTYYKSRYTLAPMIVKKIVNTDAGVLVFYVWQDGTAGECRLESFSDQFYFDPNFTE